MSGRELTETVRSFIDRVAPAYAAAKELEFRGDMEAACLERGIQSPIEDLFWIACHTLCAVRNCDMNRDPEFDHAGSPRLFGPRLQPQVKLGKYRVDFVLSHTDFMLPDLGGSPVVVELDGHDFHDQNKVQRSYEKARDRFLVRSGFRVIHFTGSDVVKDPFACAWEALQMVNVLEGEYDPLDPMGLE